MRVARQESICIKKNAVLTRRYMESSAHGTCCTAQGRAPESVTVSVGRGPERDWAGALGSRKHSVAQQQRSPRGGATTLPWHFKQWKEEFSTFKTNCASVIFHVYKDFILFPDKIPKFTYCCDNIQVTKIKYTRSLWDGCKVQMRKPDCFTFTCPPLGRAGLAEVILAGGGNPQHTRALVSGTPATNRAATSSTSKRDCNPRPPDTIQHLFL